MYSKQFRTQVETADNYQLNVLVDELRNEKRKQLKKATFF